MKNKRIKNGLIGIGTALVPAGMTMVVQGQNIEGGILTAMGIACVLGYSLLDDADKKAILEYVDEDTLRDLADDVAERVNDDGNDEGTEKKSRAKND
jgi:hypothetical protein